MGSAAVVGDGVFEELFNLLSQLGLGSAAKPVCELIAGMVGEIISLQHLQQEIRNILLHHGRAHFTGTVVSTLVELGLVGTVVPAANEGSTAAAGAATSAARRGSSPISDSVLLAEIGDVIAVNPSAMKAVRDSARGWLDIDGGICIVVRQHGAGSDSEK
jgi:hypothetical protein